MKHSTFRSACTTTLASFCTRQAVTRSSFSHKLVLGVPLVRHEVAEDKTRRQPHASVTIQPGGARGVGPCVRVSRSFGSLFLLWLLLSRASPRFPGNTSGFTLREELTHHRQSP